MSLLGANVPTAVGLDKAGKISPRRGTGEQNTLRR